ncbi:hypothetical protein H0O03_00605 [Candidatus Micrarchaeota archaeon]|nr:hypothetical protein [Candidatus Micrarchaeota archaeon]
MKDRFPIRRKRLAKHLPESPGVWQTKNGAYYVKRGSELHKFSGRIEFNASNYEGKTREEKRRNAVRDAKLHAKFYVQLAKEGFYHPQSMFAIADSKRGNPEIIAIMPTLQVFDGSIPFEQQRQNKRDKKMLILRKYLAASQMHPDVTDYPFNWGEHGGEVYYHDMHLFHRNTMPAELKKALEERTSVQPPKEESEAAPLEGTGYEYLTVKRGSQGREKARVDALAHKELLEKMAGQRLYHPDSNFRVTRTEGGFALQVTHPSNLARVSPSKITPALLQKINAKRALVSKAGIKPRQAHEALHTFNNWAIDETGEVYYTNLHFFRLNKGRMPKPIRDLTSFREERRETL